MALTISRPQSVLAAVALGAATFALRSWLEADMARHMLVELPLLLLVGIAASVAIPERANTWLMSCNRSGAAGLAFISAVVTYWMVPVVIDQSLTSVPAACAKYACFVVAGILLRASIRAAPLALQAFFVGNWVWMLATIGLLYQNSTQRFCVNYLLARQWDAGEGLVVAAVAVAGVWVAYAVPRYRSDAAPKPIHTNA
jgi:hypothetical protein